MLRPREIAFDVSMFPVRTPTLPPATHTNSYALGEREVVLVEPSTPYDDERAAWLAWAHRIRAEGRTILGIVLTHHHEDHVGGAAFLARALDLPVWAHEETAKRVEGGLVTRFLAEGDSIPLAGPVSETWDVLHTPGHAPGHVCLVARRSRIAVVGDMVASVGTILIPPADFGGDMARYLAELARLEAVGARVGLPAHGDPIDKPSTADGVFARTRTHRLAREAKVKAAMRAEPEGLDAILARAYDDVAAAALPAAMYSLIAHVEKLERDGVAVRTEGKWSTRT